MNRKTIIALILSSVTSPILAQNSTKTALTKEEAKSMFGTYSMQRVSVHDPSVTWDPTTQQYYIFGSHRAQAYTKDLKNWTGMQAPWGMVRDNGTVMSGVTNSQAFDKQQVTTINIGGKTVDLQNFDATAWSAAYGDYSVDGNMWAPDIIYNPQMKKWCMYLSINGPHWNSSVILLTADEIDGTYTYQAPVVISGFNNASSTIVPYTKTDMQLALGSLTALPSRYDKGDSWGSYWPHCIDPCVFYDEEGQLWLSYGSWSGGIWMLQLDKETGLRDYTIKYDSDYNTKGIAVTSDPYFGKKIAGGCYVSGEASYIEHIGNYYYLFVTYGGLEADGGYEMRVFRSEQPDGPYTDTKGTNAIFSSYALNFGLNSDTRGMKVLGSYGGKWGNMSIGETAQGHNSIIAAEDGRTYLVYHTRFHDGGPGHQVRVHQVFINQDGWLVAAPFEYTGETTTDRDIATSQTIYEEDIPGKYAFLLHKYRMDHKNLEQVEPDTIELAANGSISGKYQGSWKLQEGTSYITIILNANTYKGVVVDQMLEPTKTHATAFTAVGYQGVPLWGYKIRDDYQLATAINNFKAPVYNRKNINQNADLYDTNLPDGVTQTWTSSAPDILSDYGRYNPEGLEKDSLVSLTTTLASGRYYWTNTYNVNVKADSPADGDHTSGIKAYYDFDDEPILNRYNSEQTAELKKQLSTKKATLEADNERNGLYLRQNYGKNRFACYTEFDNPLKGEELTEGLTISMWVKRNDDEILGTLFAFYDPDTKATLNMSANAHFAFNDQKGAQLSINHPDTTSETIIPVGEWQLLTVVIDAKDGLSYYLNGSRKYTERYKGTMDGNTIKKKNEFDYTRFMRHIASCNKFYFGLGGDNGSAGAGFDDLLIYDRVLNATDIKGLYKMANRVHNFGPTAIYDIHPDGKQNLKQTGTYNLSGQKVNDTSKGLLIINGKKVFKK